MTTTPREAPVREAPEWPHRPYLDGIVAAIRALPVSQYPMVKGAAVEALVSRDAVLLILEGARAIDDEGQR